jgi:hypothetical protein
VSDVQRVGAWAFYTVLVAATGYVAGVQSTGKYDIEGYERENQRKLCELSLRGQKIRELEDELRRLRGALAELKLQGSLCVNETTATDGSPLLMCRDIVADSIGEFCSEYVEDALPDLCFDYFDRHRLEPD